MGKKKRNTSKEKKEVHQEQIDKQICELADDLSSQGLGEYDLIVAVAKIYANSVLVAYIDYNNLN